MQSIPPSREFNRSMAPFYKGVSRDLSYLGSMYSSGYVRLSATVMPSWTAINAPGVYVCVHLSYSGSMYSYVLVSHEQSLMLRVCMCVYMNVMCRLHTECMLCVCILCIIVCMYVCMYGLRSQYNRNIHMHIHKHRLHHSAPSHDTPNT